MLILDRIEMPYAVLETDSGSEKVLRSQLPPEAKEGDVLRQTPDGYVVDAGKTRKRREMLLHRTRKLKKH